MKYFVHNRDVQPTFQEWENSAVEQFDAMTDDEAIAYFGQKYDQECYCLSDQYGFEVR